MDSSRGEPVYNVRGFAIGWVWDVEESDDDTFWRLYYESATYTVGARHFSRDAALADLLLIARDHLVNRQSTPSRL